MRKVLSFVLVLSLVLGSFSMAFAATPADVDGTPNEEAVQVLMGLGVVNGYPDGTFKPENIVTRAEMAKMIVVALGLEDYATGTSTFPDMAGATWAQGYVNYAAGLGIIKGYPDGTFKPSATVSYDEATAMVVRALGYTDASLLPATWPSNYVVKAKALGILDGIKSSALGANRGDIAKILYNSLAAKIGSVDADNKWTANDGTDNFLVRLGAEKAPTAALIIGNEDGLINMRAYAGVYGYTYSIDDEIVAVDAVSKKLVGKYNDDNTFTANDGVEYKVPASLLTTTGQAWFMNQGVKTLDAENATSQGTPVTEMSIDIVSSATELTVNADLSGKTITKIYSFMNWTVSDSGLFDKNDAKDIEDGTLFGANFVLDEDDNIDTSKFELLGVNSLSDIAIDDVVYMYKSKKAAGIDEAQDIVKVEVGTEVVTGKVTDEEDGDFTINGKVYAMSGEATSAPEVGDTITARLDYAGDIFSWEDDGASADSYGVVTLYNEDTYGDMVSKIFTSDDTTKRFVVDDEDTTVSTGTSLSTLVSYGLDADGVVDALDPATDDDLGALVTSKIFRINATTSYAVSADVVVFVDKGAGDFSVDTIDNVKTSTAAITGAQYIISDGELVALLVPETALKDATEDGTFAVINTVGFTLDGDDTVNKVTGFIDGVAFTKLANNDDLVEPADFQLVELNLTSAGKIDSFTTLGAVGVKLTDVSDDATVLTKNADKYMLAANAVAYEAVLKTDNKTIDKYVSAVIGDIDRNYTVWLFDTDADEDGYEVVIFANEDYTL